MFLPALCFLSLFAAACNRETPAEPKPPAAPSASPSITPTAVPVATIDAGALLTDEEVGGVQGCRMTGAQKSSGKSGQFLVSQCYYAASETNKSVSLAVTQTDPADASRRTAKQFWHETFDRYADLDSEEHDAPKQSASLAGAATGREEDEGGKNPPRRIDGLGEGAFWSGNPVGGVLYALKGEVFIRISVGGPDQQAVKLDKSKKLAEIVLKRL